MRKILLLLSVFAVLCFVSAEEYMVEIDGVPDDVINQTLQNTDWKGYTPQYNFIGDGVITFPTEKDYARFLLPCAYDNFIFNYNLFRVQKGCVYGISAKSSSTYTLNVSTGVIYIFSHVASGWNPYYASISVKNGEQTLVSMSTKWNPDGGVWKFDRYVVSDGNLIVKISLPSYSSAQVYIFDMDGVIKSYSQGVKKIEFKKIPYSLEIYTQPNANIYIDNELKGTTDNGGYDKILVEMGEHQLKITKDGFWDYTTTINIQNDTTLHIDLAPKTALFRVEKNITGNLYPNSIGDVKLTLYPIRTAYGTQMTISGADVVKVYYKNSYLAPSNGAYVLGTVDSPVDVEIQFKTPATWGEHSFAVTITATDIEGNSYTNQEQITYEVKELPFLLQTPSIWRIGDNTVTITDQSGEDYSVLLTLKTVDGKEIWSQSQGFDAYDSHDFVVPINQSGDYVLEILAKGGQVKTYVPVHVVEPIKLLTPEVNASKGSVATIKIEIQNPTSEVKYYDAQVIGEIFDVNNTPKQAFSIAPGETKIVELKFEVPENLTYDSYNLKVEVFEKGEAEPCFEGDVVLKIVEKSFIPIGLGDSGVPTWALIVGGILLIGGVGAYLVMRK